MKEKSKVILVEDDENWLRILHEIIDEYFEVEIDDFLSFAKAEERLRLKPVDFQLLVTDILPGELLRRRDGLKFAIFGKEVINIPVIIVTGDLDSARVAKNNYDFLSVFDKGEFSKKDFIDCVNKVETIKSKNGSRIPPRWPDDLVKKDISKKTSLFLSYNNYDYPIAIRIKEELKKYQVDVRIDKSDVQPGRSIRDFIVNQAKENDAVMVLLSKNSLRSPWVIYESMVAIFNNLVNKKEIIPVKVDDSFNDDIFSLEIIEIIDKEILAKKNSIYQHELKGVIAEHIHSDLIRLTDARSQLPKVLLKFREVAVFSVAGSDFELTLKQIANLINKVAE